MLDRPYNKPGRRVRSFENLLDLDLQDIGHCKVYAAFAIRHWQFSLRDRCSENLKVIAIQTGIGSRCD